MRFTVSTDVEIFPGTTSTVLAHEIVDYLVQPETWEKHLRLLHVQDEGHTTEKGIQPVPRYHFSATKMDSRPLLPSVRQSRKINLSYVQDPTFPEVKFTMTSPTLKYFSRAVRITEHERGGRTYLEVKCDVVVEYKWAMFAFCFGTHRQLENDHEALLAETKAEFETKQKRPHSRKL